MVKIEPDEISSIIRQQIAQYSEEVKSLLLEQYFKLMVLPVFTVLKR
jgi:hypothetical protein